MKQVDFELVKGDDRTLTFHVTNADGTDTNLSSAVIEWIAVRDLVDANAVSITKTSVTPSQILIEVPAEGYFSIYLVPSDTSTFDVGVYDHQATVTDSAGKVTTVFNGSMTLTNRLAA